jgi:lipase
VTLVKHRFAAPAGDLCWFEWGEAGQGPTLLLLHATGFHARCWDAVLAALPETAHVAALDLPGHGRSYRPESLADWTATADAVQAFLDWLDRPVFAIGHSMGGCIAARLAAVRPDLVTQALLIDPVIMPRDYYAQADGQAVFDPVSHPVARRRNQWDSAEQMIARFAGRAPYASWRPDVLADYCRHGLLPAQDGTFELACPPLLEASAYAGSAAADPWSVLADVQCPVTVVRAKGGERSGAIDFSISPTDPDLAKAFAHGNDLHWPEHSHFIPMEVPDRVAALIWERMR